MHAIALSATLEGVHAHVVRVEVDSGRGLPTFNIVGLPEASVRESRVRVRSALRQLGVELNEHAITVNLAPADVRKAGSAFDLAIALGTLAALGELPADTLQDRLLLGELSLSGELHAVRGVLPALLCAGEHGIARAMVPTGNESEAAGVRQVRSVSATTLAEAVAHLRDGMPLATASGTNPGSAPAHRLDMAEVRGQLAARRMLEIAAAGSHNLLMVGSPGAGKTMLAERLPTILPPLSEEESLEITAIHSVAGLLAPQSGLMRQRPFRAPHHTISSAGMLGGGRHISPGEISLAHHGCLFLDELLEFRRDVIEALRQPLESGCITICRARGRATFPAQALLVAAVNPCPCGYGHDPRHRCRCSPAAILRYRQRLSGPLIDRMDLHVALPPVSISALGGDEQGEGSSSIRRRVRDARQRQRQRQQRGLVTARYNGALGRRELDACAPLTRPLHDHLDAAMRTLGLSARAYIKVRRIALTIADLEGCGAIEKHHLAEALQCRLYDGARGM